MPAGAIGDSWLFLDILGSIYVFPLFIDAASGAWYEPKRELVFQDLVKSSNPMLAIDPNSINFSDVSVLGRA